MKKSAFISDLLFAFFIAFIVAVCLLRYFRFPLFSAFLCGTLIGIICSIILFFPLDKKRKKIITEKKEGIERDNFCLYLALLSLEKQAAFCEKLLPETEDKKTLRLTSGVYFWETENALYFPYFTVRPVDGDAAAQRIRLESEKNKILLCSSLSDETEKLLKRFGVSFQGADEIYRIAKEKDLLPTRYPFEKEEEKPLRRKAKIWFSKRNGKPFLTGGVLLLTSSLITPFPVYYLSVGLLLLSCAVLVRIFGYR